MAWGSKQQESTDTHVVIDGRTGRVIEQDQPTDRNTDRGTRQDRGTAQWTYDEYGRPTPYTPGQEW